MLLNCLLLKQKHRTGPWFFLQESHSLICILMFTQVGEEVEVKTNTIYHCAACLIYATTHNKPLLVNNIFMNTMKTKSSWCYLLYCPRTHTHTTLLNQICHGYGIHANINLHLYCSETQSRITSLNYLHNNLYFWNLEKTRVPN